MHGLRKIDLAKIINREKWTPPLPQKNFKGDYGGGGILKFFRYKDKILVVDEFTGEVLLDNPFEDFLKWLSNLEEHTEIIPELEWQR